MLLLVVALLSSPPAAETTAGAAAASTSAPTPALTALTHVVGDEQRAFGVKDGCKPKLRVDVDEGQDDFLEVRPLHGTCGHSLVSTVDIWGVGGFEGEVEELHVRQTAFGARTITLEGAPGGLWTPSRFVVTAQAGALVRVELQKTSVMQCSAEGPHVEFWEWRLGRSPWTAGTTTTATATTATATTSTTTFAEAATEQVEAAFPKWTPVELKGLLKKADLADWDTASCAPTTGEYRYRIRVAKTAGAPFVTVVEYAFRPALGC